MYKLLIVDDEAIIRRGLSNIIPWNELGFEVAGVLGNAMEALNVMDQEQIHVLLTDISMPEMSGLDLIRHAKERCPGIKTVVISGYSEFDYAIEAIKLKVENYILKPLDPEKIADIFMKIREALDKEKKSRGAASHGTDYRAEEEKLIALIEQGQYKIMDEVIHQMFLKLRDLEDADEACDGILERLCQYFQISGLGGTDLEQEEQEGTEERFKKKLLCLLGRLKANSESMASLISYQAKQCIDEMYPDKELSLKSVAEELHVSYGYLSTAFAKTFDKSFKAYLVSVRIEKARQLLMERKYKVYEIADLVGYSSSRYFNDAFKKKYGISPVDYLNRINKNLS